MNTIRFHCTKELSGKHDANVKLADIILHWPPICCDKEMTPASPDEWRCVSKTLNLVNTELREAGLPDLAGLLFQAQRSL